MVFAYTGTNASIVAKNAGIAGNGIDIRLNYLGAAGGEAFPPGTLFVVSPMSGGMVNPSLSAALANLGDMPFDIIVHPYTDPTSLDALKTFLADANGRWAWNAQIYGHAITGVDGTVGERQTLGSTRNDQHHSIAGLYNCPTPSWVWAATLAGAVATSVRADPGQPLQTLALPGMLAPASVDRDTIGEQNTLLWDGISTLESSVDGTVRIGRLITTYRTNASGLPDNSYLSAERMFLLMYVLRRLRSLVTTKYARMKLADDGTHFASGSNIVTPSLVKTDLVSDYREMEFEGYVQGSDVFAQNLIVERNASDPDRLDVLYPADLIDQLNVFAVLVQFT